MKYWAAFSASDINNDHKLDMEEIPALLHIMEGIKPSNYRINQELKIIKQNHIGKDGTLSRSD